MCQCCWILPLREILISGVFVCRQTTMRHSYIYRYCMLSNIKKIYQFIDIKILGWELNYSILKRDPYLTRLLTIIYLFINKIWSNVEFIEAKRIVRWIWLLMEYQLYLTFQNPLFTSNKIRKKEKNAFQIVSDIIHSCILLPIPFLFENQLLRLNSFMPK